MAFSLVEFELSGVPISWSNKKVWSRKGAIVQHVQMKEWTQNVIFWGAIQRGKAGWPRAMEPHPQRTVTIHQLRHGELDDDNLFSSIKPLIDGCKSNLRRKGKAVLGAGLIWNDNPRHCHILASQERIPMSQPCKTIIRVERFDICS
jgi:hypothetical protein